MKEEQTVIKGHYICYCGAPVSIKVHRYPSTVKTHYTYVCKDCGLYMDTYNIKDIYRTFKKEGSDYSENNS